MPNSAATPLPLEMIRYRARMHVAAQTSNATNLYVHNAIYRAGEVIQPKRLDIVIPRDSVLVFADDEPLKNWGHRCRYLLHDPKTGALTQEIPSLLPPTLDFGTNFQAFHEPVTFPVSKSSYPVVALPAYVALEPASQWHAILFAGASMNRHVNDVEFLYRVLVDNYFVPPGNIQVLSYDGTLDYNDSSWQRVTPPVGNWPGDNTPYQMKINGAGTKAELLAAIAAVGKKLGPGDNLLLHTNNHGGRIDNDTVSTLISYSGDDTTPTDLATAIQALPKFNALMVMMEQCFAGGFIQPILNASPAQCTSVATAVDAHTSSDGGAYWDPFALAWINAMAGAHPDGSALPSDPDTTGNGSVSAREAFTFAKATDTGPDDNPQFGQNSPCGGATTLVSNRRSIFIPPLYRYLFPWQIIPDPSPEQIRQIAVQIGTQLRSTAFRTNLATSLQDERDRIANIVRAAVTSPAT